MYLGVIVEAEYIESWATLENEIIQEQTVNVANEKVFPPHFLFQ
jgi:hypothetical protein